MKDGIGTDGQIGGRFGAQVMRQVFAGYIISVKSALLLENCGWWVEMPEMQKSIVFCIIFESEAPFLVQNLVSDGPFAGPVLRQMLCGL